MSYIHVYTFLKSGENLAVRGGHEEDEGQKKKSFAQLCVDCG